MGRLLDCLAFQPLKLNAGRFTAAFLRFATGLGVLGLLGWGSGRQSSFDPAGCTSVHAFDKFPLKSLWRIHRQQHLDLLGRSFR